MTLDEALRVAEEACREEASHTPSPVGMKRLVDAAAALARLREELPKSEEVANFLMMLCIAAEK